jgi:hypothetical protein
MTTTAAIVLDPVAEFRKYKYFREAGENHGLRINGVQVWAGGHDGDSYCCELTWVVLDVCFQGNSPLGDRKQACEDVYQLALREGWITDTPQPGDLFVYLDANGHAHHIGMLTEINADTPTGWNAVAGNTSQDGTSSNGTGVWEHPLLRPRTGSIKYIAYPRG